MWTFLFSNGGWDQGGGHPDVIRSKIEKKEVEIQRIKSTQS